jgi:hypothetical protein
MKKLKLFMVAIVIMFATQGCAQTNINPQYRSEGFGLFKFISEPPINVRDEEFCFIDLVSDGWADEYKKNKYINVLSVNDRYIALQMEPFGARGAYQPIWVVMHKDVLQHLMGNIDNQGRGYTVTKSNVSYGSRVATTFVAQDGHVYYKISDQISDNLYYMLNF